jgi:uncharacterized membrane protein YidH (DUF202 family)
MTTIETPPQPQGGDQSQRVAQFKQEIADMRLRDPATARERMFLRGGVLLMVIGVGFSIAGYFGSHNTTNALSQRDYITVALIGVSISVVGAAVFLRYSIAQFLRFWLARLSYEHQHQTDRLIEKIGE